MGFDLKPIKITLGIGRYDLSQNISIKQGYIDTLKVSVSFINKDGSTFQIPSGSTAKVRMLKPDKKKVLDDTENNGVVEGNKVLFDITNQMQAYPGDGALEIILFNGGQTVTSSTCGITIIENVHDDSGIESTDEWLTVLNTLAQIEEVTQAATDLVAEIETKLANGELTGPPGATGLTGLTGPQGKGFNPRGDWTSGTAYVNNTTTIDTVTYNGSGYACKTSHTASASILPTNTTYWNLIVQKGDTGPQGPKGTDGTGTGDVTLTGTQTLTNKTLTSPILTTPKMSSGTTINDANGNELIRFPAAVSSAVNEITVNNSATGVAPSIQASGTDSNVGLSIMSKGSSTIRMYVNNAISTVFDAVSSAVNYLIIRSNVTGTAPTIEAGGTDNNIGIDIKSKGTGVFRTLINGAVSFVVDAVASAVNYLTVKANTAGNAPTIAATGTDTNIDVNVIPKGTGRLKENGTIVALSSDLTSYHSLIGKIVIPANADLNAATYKSIGNYYCPTTADSQTILNMPSLPSIIINAFNLKVFFGTGTGYPIQQVEFYDSGITYRRVFDPYLNSGAGGWLSWSYVSGPSAGYAPNILINGDFQVWQRGTTFALPTNGSYSSDRWGIWNYIDSNVKVLKGYKSLRVEEYNAVGGANAYTPIYQNVEDYAEYAGKTLTLSCNISLDAGVSAEIAFYDGVSSHFSGSFSTGGTKAITATMASNATQLQIIITFFRNGLAIGKGLNINWVKLEVNDHATPFIPRSYGEELTLCQRYYEKSYNTDITPGTPAQGPGLEYKVVPNDTVLVAQSYGKVNFKVAKRVAPTVVIYPYTTPSNTGRVSNLNGTDLVANSGLVGNTGSSGFQVYNGTGGSITTSGSSVLFHWVADAEI